MMTGIELYRRLTGHSFNPKDAARVCQYNGILSYAMRTGYVVHMEVDGGPIAVYDPLAPETLLIEATCESAQSAQRLSSPPSLW